jgi:hypothetical protein
MGDFLAWFSMSIANSMQKPNYNELWTASVYMLDINLRNRSHINSATSPFDATDSLLYPVAQSSFSY